MQIGYFKTIQTNDFIDIEDVSNCAVEAYTDDGRVYTLVIKTNYGLSQIFEYGPTMVDPNIPCKFICCSYKTMEYTDNKVCKLIETFLNEPKREITQALELDIDEALDNCPSIIDYMKKEVF